jgi:DMSO/TMAO reductase YedYZ molybdopterin-dependent catalytic subunit
MQPRCLSLLIALAPILLLSALFAQDSSLTLSVRGDVQKPAQWSMAQLKVQFAGDVQSIKFTAGKDKQTKVGKGVPLLSVIKLAAPKTDPSMGHHDLKFFVILEAKDGYQAFFSLAELTPREGGSPTAFLIWDLDGQPLPEKEAPLRLVLTADGEARQIHAVTAITLVDGVKLANQLKAKN